ncbi:MAG: sulfatase-like hydrolase/transferase [Microthrixaceae bacterium]|nr:sulfatase-like hydrolase/transferase [Microthrixaceae bacterium]
MDFIHRAEADDDQPFSAYVAPTSPHPPLGAPPRYADHAWKGTDAPRTPNFYEPDVSDKSAWLRESAGNRDRTRGWNDRDWKNRMGSLLALDDLVAATVETLRTHGELDNTGSSCSVSDNGYNLGSHRLVNKMAPYEESIRVPMVVTGPGIRTGHETRMVIGPDIAPDDPRHRRARTARVDRWPITVPLLGDGPGPDTWRRDFIAQYLGGATAQGIGEEFPPNLSFHLFVLLLAAEIPSYSALRTEDHLYVEWDQTDMGEGVDAELYDLDTDPYQLDNLLATESGRTENEELARSCVHAWPNSVVVRVPRVAPDPSTGANRRSATALVNPNRGAGGESSLGSVLSVFARASGQMAAPGKQPGKHRSSRTATSGCQRRRSTRASPSGRGRRYAWVMESLRTLDEAERIINANGRAPHDEHIVLNDGRVLRTADEVREWVRSMAVAAADGDAV